MIQEGQTGVVLQFGKYSYTTRSGINWRMPWPFQSHEVVNLSSIRSVEVGRSTLIKASNLKDSSMLTEDENIIDVKFAVQYRLKDASEYLFNNRDPDAAVVQAAETVVRELVGRSKMDNVLYENREKLAVDLNSSIQKILDSYKDIVPKAKGMADRLMQEAEGYKAKVVATAEGDATRFKLVQAEYAKAPQVTRERMYIDTMQEIYNNVTKVMVDSRGQSGNLLYLPLDKLIQQTAPVASQPAATGTVSSSSTSQTPAPASSGSSGERRDGNTLRSRDRERN
jgi:membrane protease subunit HflK